MPELHHATERYLACRSCRQIERLLPDLAAVLDGDDLPFAARHEGHKVEAVSRLGDAFLSDKPVWDPTATTYFEVSNGDEILMVRSGRGSIEDPVQRTLVPGRLRLDHVAVEFETDLIRRAIDAHFFPHAIRPAKIEQLLNALGDLCNEIDADRLEIVFDSAEEPQVQYARLPEPLFDRLMIRCESIFDEWERERLESFFANARGDDGLFCLRVTRAFVVEAA